MLATFASQEGGLAPAHPGREESDSCLSTTPSAEAAATPPILEEFRVVSFRRVRRQEPGGGRRIRFFLSTTPSAEAAATPPIQEGSFVLLASGRLPRQAETRPVGRVP